jgi:pimeloyl-ACP methyl ester carboxylesterase
MWLIDRLYKTIARGFRQPFSLDERSVRYAAVEDILVGYRVFGSGSPLLMVPAYMMTMDTWDPCFIERLARRHSVIVFDNRGMGETSPGDREFTVERFAADTAGLIVALGYEKAHVLGWSIGGDIALCLAAEHPERVDRVVSYAGDCGGPQKVGAPGYGEVLAKLDDVQGVVMKDAFGALFPAWWMEAHPDYWKQFPVPETLPDPGRVRQQDRAYEEWQGVYDRLPGMTTPVLAVTGSDDVSTPPENARILAGRLPDCKLVEFPGAGHGLQYMYPIGLANVVLDFLSS